MFEQKLVRFFMQWHCWRWVLGLIPYFHHCFEWEWLCLGWFLHFFLSFSILGRIIRVTDEVVEYRCWIKKTFPRNISENSLIDSKSRSYAMVANSGKTGGSKSDLSIDNTKRSDFFCFNCFNIEYTTFDVLFVSRAV